MSAEDEVSLPAVAPTRRVRTPFVGDSPCSPSSLHVSASFFRCDASVEGRASVCSAIGAAAYTNTLAATPATCSTYLLVTMPHKMGALRVKARAYGGADPPTFALGPRPRCPGPHTAGART